MADAQLPEHITFKTEAEARAFAEELAEFVCEEKGWDQTRQAEIADHLFSLAQYWEDKDLN